MPRRDLPFGRTPTPTQRHGLETKSWLTGEASRPRPTALFRRGLATLAAFGFLPVACSEEPDTSSDGLGGSDGVVIVGSGGLASGGSNSTEGTGGTGGSMEVTPPEQEVCTLGGMETRAKSGGSPLIDDFDDGDDRFSGNGVIGQWFSYDDETDGTQSPDSNNDWAPEPGGVTESGYALHLQGGGFTTWGSGQSAVLAYESGENCLLDASIYDGISFWVRGTIEPTEDADLIDRDQGALIVILTDKDVIPIEDGGRCDPQEGTCWDAHRVRIKPDECWQRYALSISEFAPDGFGNSDENLNLSELVNLSFSVAQDQNFDLWIDELSFYEGDPPAEEKICPGGMGGAGGAGGG